mgnify:CR=1 FL=1
MAIGTFALPSRPVINKITKLITDFRERSTETSSIFEAESCLNTDLNNLNNLTLLDNASLIVTPNSYKESTILSIVPKYGTGDLTFVRATTATRVNPNGFIENIDLNIPRIDYTSGGCPSILVEPQRTNLSTRSDDFANWAAKSNIVITSNVLTSPTGLVDADLLSLVPDASSTRHRLYNVISYTAGLTYTFSVFVKKADQDWIQLILQSTAFSTDAWANFNVANGTIGNQGGAGSPKVENYGNGWYRISITATATVSTATTNEIFPTNNVDGGRYQSFQNLANVNVCYLWGGQVEQGSYSTSIIPTLASAVTRNADVISKTGISQLIGQTEGTIFVNFKRGNNPERFKCLFYLHSDTSNFITINSASESTEVFQYSVSLGGTFVQEAFTLNNEGQNKIVLKYTNTLLSLFVNGVFISSTTISGLPIMDKLFLGHRIGGRQFGRIGDFQLYKTALTDDECTLLSGTLGNTYYTTYEEMATNLNYNIQ